MKKALLLAALALSAGSAFAFSGFDPIYLPSELKAIRADLGDKDLGQVKVSELIPLAERLDVARQKDQFVALAAGISMAWPGAGQFLAGDWGTGAVHTGVHLGVTAATLVWAHSLLPADLQMNRLNYFGDSRSTIDAAWGSHSFNEFWPMIGALAAGGAVDLVLRAYSAHDAVDTARSRIDAGKIEFSPRFDDGHFGLGMRY
jgi:hypothetical protein